MDLPLSSRQSYEGPGKEEQFKNKINLGGDVLMKKITIIMFSFTLFLL